MEFSLHAYIKRLRKTGAPSDYIDAVRRNALPLAEYGLPVILTLGQLAHATGMPYGVLLGIIEREIDPYRVFTIRKRSGGKRFICVPEPCLLAVQRWIHHHILCSPQALKCLSSNATAYRPSSSHIANAERHVGADWVLKVDITRFFESISERQVYHVFRGLGYRALVAFCLTRLCTRILPARSDKRLHYHRKRWMPGRDRQFLSALVVGHLPQGAPTSPMLANLVCVALDSEIQKIALRESLVYTRYADDMTLSGCLVDRDAAEKLISEISRIVGKYGFGVNSQKTNIAKNGGRKIVTGLSVEGDDIRLPRAYKDELKKELYFLKKYGPQNHCAWIGQKNHLSYLLRLAGRIRYVVSVEPAIGSRMMTKFSQAVPQFAVFERLVLNRRQLKGGK
jgi:RNA-directed DNA polymerase